MRRRLDSVMCDDLVMISALVMGPFFWLLRAGDKSARRGSMYFGDV